MLEEKNNECLNLSFGQNKMNQLLHFLVVFFLVVYPCVYPLLSSLRCNFSPFLRFLCNDGNDTYMHNVLVYFLEQWR